MTNKKNMLEKTQEETEARISKLEQIRCDEMIEGLILQSLPELREITFHTDGRVIAKTGGRARFPKKLYTGRGKDTSEKLVNALTKLIAENKE